MNKEICHANIFYIRDISIIGGVETFVYEMCKKYKDLDIAVVYKTADPNQLKRIKEYCKAYRHTNQRIKCKVAIINYDTSIIDYIDNGADIYQTIHADYENKAYTVKAPTHPRIKEYIAITKYILESFKRITGQENVILSYNPLTITPMKKKLVLVSATRLSKIKGKDRMIALANALDKAGIDYIWYVFTNDTNAIQNENVIYMKQRLDIQYWLTQADYLVQLSDTEGCSYSINEALYQNVACILTPLPYLKEIGVEDGKNAYIMEFDCSNVDDIVKKIQNVPKFEFKHLEDSYGKILADSKSHYEEEKYMKAQVKCIKPNGYTDLQLGQFKTFGEVYTVEIERAEFLASKGAVEILGYVDENPAKVKKEENPFDEFFKDKEIVDVEVPKKTRKRKSKE